MPLLSSPQNLYLMAQTGGSGGLMAFLPLVIIMGIFYVLLILPAQRRQVVPESVARTLTQWMIGVTAPGGTGENLFK